VRAAIRRKNGARHAAPALRSDSRFTMSLRILLASSLALLAIGCSGGSGSSNNNDGMPAPSSTNATTVSIVGQRNEQSFSPNPAPIANGSTVVWQNTDTVTHRIVLNDGSFDSGNLAPGASSPAMRLTNAGGNYHCSIHPTTMFGSINVATTMPDPGTGLAPYSH
jgi:plastocyanin